MLDEALAGRRGAVGERGQAPAEQRFRRRALAAVAALVLLGHALLLGDAGPLRLGTGPEPMAPSLSVRTIAAPPPEVEEAPAEAPTVAAPVVRPPAPAPKRERRAREPAAPAAADAPVAAASAPEPAAPEVVADAASSPAALAPAEPPAPDADVASAPAEAPPPSAGDPPPPVYRTDLPAPATLHYQVLNGFFRGTGEIRWRRNDDAYSLELEARIAGIPLLRMASDGTVDAAGLAPRRFVDQRARRAAQAANFQREAGKVTFSGKSVEFPLVAGSQDELSWMIQLAGIVRAQPGLLVEGGRIAMVVVGARGVARVWTLRYAGTESVDTRAGPVPAVKLVREGVGPYDRGYEVWLDPARDHLPAHMTQRNAAGESVFDLLLDRIDPVP